MTRLAGAVLVRGALLVALWWILAEGEPPASALAAGSLAAALAASLLLVRPGAARVRPLALARFVPFFLRHSAGGAIDVARRALHPRLPVAPAFVDYPLRLPPGGSRVVFANVVSLLPGTLAAELLPDRLVVHLLDRETDPEPRLRALEERVAALFGLEL